MKHSAATDDGFQVLEWVGQVPRVGETILALGSPTGWRGKWRVVEVTWSAYVETPMEAFADLVVVPADYVAVKWLEESRAERERARKG